MAKIMASVQIEHFYLGCLAHASYLVESDGVAAVIDPQRDVDIYLEAAKQKNLKIEHIIETHLHADFVSVIMSLPSAPGRAFISAKALALGFLTRRSKMAIPSSLANVASTFFRRRVTPSKASASR